MRTLSSTNRRVPASLLGLSGLIVALSGLVLAADTQKSNWPQWRGPDRNGISTELHLRKDWTAEPPPMLWKKSGLGSGYASLAIVDGIIYTAGRKGKDNFLMALKEEDGSEIWATKFGGEGGNNPRGTPTIDGDLLYTISGTGDLICAQKADGKIVWSLNFDKDFGGRMMSGWGYCESPLIDGDRLICTPGSDAAMIVALDKKTGKTIWKSELPKFAQRGKDGAGYSSVVISNAAGVKQYVQLIGRGCIGVRAEDGKFLWGYDRVANGTANIPTPIVDGDYVFCSSGYGTGSALLRIAKTDDGLKAEEQYFLDGKTLQNHHGGMIKLGDYIYAGHGNNRGAPVCLEMKTGRIAWREDRDPPGRGSAAIIYANGQLYLRYQDGTMALIDEKPDSYQVHGTFKIPGANDDSWAHPVVLHGKLFLREQDNLMVYDISEKN